MTPILCVLLLSALFSLRLVGACQDCVTGLTCYSGHQPLDDFMSGRHAQHRRQKTCAEADLCLRVVHDDIVELKCAEASSTNHRLPFGCSNIASDDVAVESCVCNTDLCNGLVSVSRSPFHNVTKRKQATRNSEPQAVTKGFRCYVCRIGPDVTCPMETCESEVKACVTDRYRSVIRRTCGAKHAKYVLGCHVMEHKGFTAEYCYCDTPLCNGLTTKGTTDQSKESFQCHVCVEGEGTDCPAMNCGGDVTACVTVQSGDQIERKCGEKIVLSPPGCVQQRVDDKLVEFCHCHNELCNRLKPTESSVEGQRMSKTLITTLCIVVMLITHLLC